MYNTVLIELRIKVCFGKSEVSVERISVRDVTEKRQSMANTVRHAPEPVTSDICVYAT